MIDLFVYGTLMRGRPQGGLLRRFEHVKATAIGRLWRLPAGYPALELGPFGSVHGELVRQVDPRVVSLLDQVEGVDQGLYRRVGIDVVNGLRTFRAEGWVMDQPQRRGGIEIPTGRWTGAICR